MNIAKIGMYSHTLKLNLEYLTNQDKFWVPRVFALDGSLLPSHPGLARTSPHRMLWTELLWFLHQPLASLSPDMPTLPWHRLHPHPRQETREKGTRNESEMHQRWQWMWVGRLFVRAWQTPHIQVSVRCAGLSQSVWSNSNKTRVETSSRSNLSASRSWVWVLPVFF